MENYFLTKVFCIYCAIVCCVSGQQTGALPTDDEKKSSEDSSKFIPITNSSPKFSLGLGVLSPSYTQKFGDDGKTRLDFNQDSGGYSYSLAHPITKSTDRSGTDDKKYSTDTMKAAGDGDTHQLPPSSQYNPSSYSLSVGTGSRSDYSSVGNGYPQTQVSVINRQGSQGGPPMPQTYSSYGQNYGPNYSPMPGYGTQGFAPMPYQSYPNSGPQYSQSGAYSPSAITPVASTIQSSPAQPPYSVQTPPTAPQPYPVAAQPQPQYNPYMAQMASPYGGYGQQPMSPYGMSPYGSPAPQMSPQMSPYGGYGNQYGSGAGVYGSQSPYGGGGGGYGMYGSPSSPSASAYPYGGGSSDPLANLSPDAINTLRQLYGASSTMSMSYMSPYSSGMGSSMGGSSGGLGGYGSSGGYGGGGGGGSGGGLSSLISLFG